MSQYHSLPCTDSLGTRGVSKASESGHGDNSIRVEIHVLVVRHGWQVRRGEGVGSHTGRLLRDRRLPGSMPHTVIP